MKIKPVLTEKSMGLAKAGKYTFWVDPGLTKGQLKAQIAKLFEVKVVEIKTITIKGGVKKNFKGHVQGKTVKKKAIVSLAKDQKIDLFEEQK